MLIKIRTKSNENKYKQQTGVINNLKRYNNFIIK
jgi:hypothetical protein